MKGRQLAKALTIIVLVALVGPGHCLCVQAQKLGSISTARGTVQTVENTFQLSIKTEKTTYSSGEQIKLQFVLRNASKHEIVIAERAAWEDYILAVKTDSGHSAPLTEFGEKLESFRKTSKQRRETVKFKNLKPGDELTETLGLLDFYKMTSGNTYLITATRKIYKEAGENPMEVVSNTLKIKIDVIIKTAPMSRSLESESNTVRGADRPNIQDVRKDRKGAYQLLARTETIADTPRETPRLTLTVWNGSKDTIYLVETGSSRDFEFEVKDRYGKSVSPRTDDRHLQIREAGKQSLVAVNAGQGISYTVDLGDLYDLADGQYTVTIKKIIFLADRQRTLEIKSGPLELIVRPSK